MTKQMGTLTVGQVQQYEEVQSQLTALYAEVTTLAKKSPDAPLNGFKVKIVNERLRSANQLLDGIHRPFESFDQFNEDDLPTGSDVALVLSQYLNSLEGWRSANIVERDYTWYWKLKNTLYKSEAPSRFRTDG